MTLNGTVVYCCCPTKPHKGGKCAKECTLPSWGLRPDKKYNSSKDKERHRLVASMCSCSCAKLVTANKQGELDSLALELPIRFLW
jgi:hypothetical protein